MKAIKVKDALLFAALSGPFKPSDALLPLKTANRPGDLAMAATRLADACDTRPTGADGLWLIRTPTRHALLEALSDSALVEEVAKRFQLGPDEETQDLLAVLLDQSPLSHAQILQTLETAHEREQIERIILALDRAGKRAPSKDLLPLARATLARFDQKQKMDQVAERGFFGREMEYARIAAWLAFPAEGPPATCLFLTGAPGIGKSTLLAESVRRFYEQKRPLILRLDFDRAGLDVLDLLGLTMEAARQLADQLDTGIESLLEARVAAGIITDESAKSKSAFRRALPTALARRLGEAVSSSGRTILVVLDTLEVLRSRGETQPVRLFEWLDSLLDYGVKPMQVLAAGRGDALDSLQRASSNLPNVPPRYIEHFELLGLEDHAAGEFLFRLGAPQRYWRELLELAQGNPLKLRLGAEIAKRTGDKRLPRRKRGEEVSSAFLYRLLLSRIDDPLLKRLAHPGLIVRRINAQVIREVLAPALGLGKLTIEQADKLWGQLATHHWLVEVDPGAPDFLKHRSDMRSLLLPLLYSSSASRSARVDAAALRWFAKLDRPWAQVEAVYHQLQLTRTGNALPSVSSQIAAQFDDQTLEELPRQVADWLRSKRGERTSELRGDWATGAADHEAAIVSESIAILKRQDWAEGAYLVRSITSEGGLDVRSRAADAVRMLLWRSGQWAQAKRWLVERDRFTEVDDDLYDLPEELALVRLEMRAEFSPDRLRQRWLKWRPEVDRLAPAAETASDDNARQGALALLMANLPDPYEFAAMRKRHGNFAGAPRKIWLEKRSDGAAEIIGYGRQRLTRVIPENHRQNAVETGRVLATLTPYVAFAKNLLVMPQNNGLAESVERFAGEVGNAGGLLEQWPSVPVRMNISDPLGSLTDIGLFADWAQASALIVRNENLLLIGRAAERWRRTMAGKWSIGRPFGPWRSRPSLDHSTEARLHFLLESPNGVKQARWRIQVWEDSMPANTLLPFLRKRTGRLQIESGAQLSRFELLQVITRRLLARGIPAVFAPALAVLILHGER
ncbi:ATP-binding protein [Pseudomonas sp. HS6]|uniref:ATP-binding protein n=1 Tax=Pseudomonas sp. HS6 TaxID=2850559 RepID=UPI00201A1E78|nr:ATP-binding protein [Pseudomonas sp. HS6]UQS16294.1 ATP-binding protein [Pseudomonas sp. HS6]